MYAGDFNWKSYLMYCCHKIWSVLWEVFLAVGGGIVGSYMYDRITTNKRKEKNKELYSYLDSNEKYEWVCYNLNGMELGEKNGSTAKIKYENNNELIYEWKEENQSEGFGKMIMLDPTFGKLTYHYKKGKHFSGFKSFFIGEKEIGGKQYDFIYSIEDKARGLNNELLLREKKRG